MAFFLCVIGMVMFIEGLPYAAFPVKMKEWIKMVMTMPSATLRGFGLLMMLSGLLLVYAAKG
jgi:uncharacterized protein YjeT (DUF2065 family)